MSKTCGFCCKYVFYPLGNIWFGMVWYKDIIWVGQYLMITSNKVVIKAKSFFKSIQKDGRKDESVDEAGITKKSSVLVKIYAAARTDNSKQFP